jgi:hypothetical protein
MQINAGPIRNGLSGSLARENQEAVRGVVPFDHEFNFIPDLRNLTFELHNREHTLAPPPGDVNEHILAMDAHDSAFFPPTRRVDHGRGGTRFLLRLRVGEHSPDIHPSHGSRKFGFDGLIQSPFIRLLKFLAIELRRR